MPMRLGVIFPQTEIGADPAVIRDYAQSVEGMGYDHLGAFDHVLGATPDRPGGWTGAYTHESMFHEPMVLFGFFAAATRRIELVTSILILPQRQTALVAKQAAEIDILSGGRLRLGVGSGWNAVEYEGLGQDFHRRGRRMEEQVALLRALWAEDVISFEGRFDRVTMAGINPRPARQIPIWFGGMADAVIDRVGRIADGWFPQYRGDASELAAGIARVRASAVAAGRDPDAIGFEAVVSAADGARAAADRARALRAAGATHISINTMRSNLHNVRRHLDVVREFMDEIHAAPDPVTGI